VGKRNDYCKNEKVVVRGMLNLELVGQGATTKIYRNGNTAIKLYVNAPHNEAENEADRQRFAYNSGLPVPVVYGVRKLDEKTVALDMEYINGQPLMRQGMDKAELLSLLLSLDDGSDCLCHSDFHPLNILYDGNKHWIIDWVDATAGNPLADACRTYLIFKQYMSRSAGIYLRMFCNEAKTKQNDVLAWQPVIAAARLSENMDDKARTWLLDLISEWNNTTNGIIT
jgi:tRNA A-37 threonylcarbamoyl transferase component Bud32